MPFENNNALDQRPAACNRKIFAGFEIKEKKKKGGGECAPGCVPQALTVSSSKGVAKCCRLALCNETSNENVSDLLSRAFLQDSFD